MTIEGFCTDLPEVEGVNVAFNYILASCVPYMGFSVVSSQRSGKYMIQRLQTHVERAVSEPSFGSPVP